jgi:hypothetical protein
MAQPLRVRIVFFLELKIAVMMTAVAAMSEGVFNPN